MRADTVQSELAANLHCLDFVEQDYSSGDGNSHLLSEAPIFHIGLLEKICRLQTFFIFLHGDTP